MPNVLLTIGALVIIVALAIGFIVGASALLLLLLKNLLYGTVGTVALRFIGSKLSKKKAGMSKKG